MHVLLIGGSRFMGYQLVWRLLIAGHRVTLLNRGNHSDPFGKRVERLRADRATAEFDRQLAGRQFDAVVDFAAYTAADVRRSVEVLGGRVGHYVFISTGSVYTVLQDCPWPARETDYDGQVQPRPADAGELKGWTYGVDKRAAEDALAEAWATARFPSTRLRLPVVNGERDHVRRLESYLWRILDGGPVLLPNGGTHRLRQVYSGDVAATIRDLLGNAAAFGEAYNLAPDEEITLAELVSGAGGAAGGGSSADAGLSTTRPRTRRRTTHTARPSWRWRPADPQILSTLASSATTSSMLDGCTATANSQSTTRPPA